MINSGVETNNNSSCQALIIHRPEDEESRGLMPDSLEDMDNGLAVMKHSDRVETEGLKWKAINGFYHRP